MNRVYAFGFFIAMFFSILTLEAENEELDKQELEEWVHS